MLEAEISVKILKDTVDLVSTLVDEVKLNVSPDGINICAIDPAHVALLEKTLPKSAFEEYSADEVGIGVDLSKLKKAIKSMGADTVRLKFNPDSGRLVLRSGNITRSMGTVDTRHMINPKIPDLALTGWAEVKVGEIRNVLKAGLDFTDHFAIGVGEKGLRVACESDTDAVEVVIGGDELETYSPDSPQLSLYPLEYFLDVLKPLPVNTYMCICFNTDYPMSTTFSDISSLDDEMSPEHIIAKYFLAPRIETD